MLTAQSLRSLVEYDGTTGAFTWLARPNGPFVGPRASAIWHTRYCGKRAGSINRVVGYESIRIFNRAFWSHRVAWLYVYGEWPSGEIDHINGDRIDNRIDNLRDVGRKANAQNIRQAPKKKSGLPLGVFFNARKIERAFSASIGIDGRTKHLGYFDTPEVAHAAYLHEKRRLHLGCTI